MNLLNISNQNDLIAICKHIGTDLRALKYLQPKRKIYHVYIPKADFRAAAFIKQEMLSRGGDAVVAKHVIDGKTDYSGVLIMGTRSQLERLLIKIDAMKFWGLAKIQDDLKNLLAGLDVKEFKIKLPSERILTLDKNTKLMAILNLTPDSFYENSRIENEKDLLTRAEKFLNDGAEILDLGAESTRPNFTPVDEDEEIKRLLPALKILRKEFPDAIISVDTYKAKTAETAFNEGADIINDISGFNFDEKILDVIAKIKLPYVLNHIKDENTHESNLLEAMNLYFDEKIKILTEHGVERERIIIDPGLGFGKTPDENYLIVKNIECFKIFNLPVLVGHSRKRFTGVANNSQSEKLAATLAVTSMLAQKVNILRVHDVSENFAALEISKRISEINFKPELNNTLL